MNHLFDNKTILITGGLGSIGEKIVDELLKYNPSQVRVLDNRETELFYARKKLQQHKNLRFFHGDVREKERLMKAAQGVDIIFHAAALKHVFLSEYDPYEAIKTNVLGTHNIIETALAQNVDKVILISTDKAVNPCNVMGTTKLLAERLISSMYYHRGRSKTKFGAVRFGNVLSSRGSVLEIWGNQIKEGKKITITDPNMTRFFMTIPESVRLIFHATELAEDGETFIFKMNSVKIGEFAEMFLQLHGRPVDDYEIVGKSKGEKDHEELLFEEEQDYILENEKLFVRLPLVDDAVDLNQRFQSKGFTFPSGKNGFSSRGEEVLLTKDQIRDMLGKHLSIGDRIL